MPAYLDKFQSPGTDCSFPFEDGIENYFPKGPPQWQNTEEGSSLANDTCTRGRSLLQTDTRVKNSSFTNEAATTAAAAEARQCGASARGAASAPLTPARRSGAESAAAAATMRRRDKSSSPRESRPSSAKRILDKLSRISQSVNQCKDFWIHKDGLRDLEAHGG